MRWLYLALAVFLLAVFLRADIQLVDLVLDTNRPLAGAAALFLGGLCLGLMLSGHKANPNSRRYAFWGMFVVLVLGLLEYSIEWQQNTVIAENQTINLAAPARQTRQHFIQAQDGLFLTEARFDGVPAEALIDTGASLVLLNYDTAQAIGLPVDTLPFDTTVLTAGGEMNIASTTLREITVGAGIKATNVATAIAPKGHNHVNLLGGSFLAQITETTVRGSQMQLTQSRWSGLHFGTEPRQRGAVVLRSVISSCPFMPAKPVQP